MTTMTDEWAIPSRLNDPLIVELGILPLLKHLDELLERLLADRETKYQAAEDLRLAEQEATRQHDRVRKAGLVTGKNEGERAIALRELILTDPELGAAEVQLYKATSRARAVAEACEQTQLLYDHCRRAVRAREAVLNYLQPGGPNAPDR